ncbi:unnamed protein product [Camellia sinensis]
MALHLGVPLSSLTHPALRKGTSALNPHRLPSTIHMCKCPTIRALSSEEIPPNALRWKRDPTWRGGFSLRVDLGMSRTGLALSKGFSIRPLTGFWCPRFLNYEGELRLIEIAERQEVDEFIIGLPKSCEGKETQQSNKVRGVAGRFAVWAAERGWKYIFRTNTGRQLKPDGPSATSIYPYAACFTGPPEPFSKVNDVYDYVTAFPGCLLIQLDII